MEATVTGKGRPVNDAHLGRAVTRRDGGGSDPEEQAPRAALAGTDKRERGFRDVVKSLLPRELVMQRWMFKEGKAEGLAKGLQTHGWLTRDCSRP